MKDSTTIARYLSVLALVLLFGSLLMVSGCGGGQSLASPGIYGSQPSSDTSNTDSPKAPPRDDANGPLTYRYDGNSDEHDPGEIPADDSTHAKTHVIPPIGHLSGRTSEAAGLYGIEVYNEDSAAAVDDDIWRLFDLAEEYYQMGVIANREASWEEARSGQVQYDSRQRRGRLSCDHAFARQTGAGRRAFGAGRALRRSGAESLRRLDSRLSG